MNNSVRPLVGISKCIEFENCRYNGSGIRSNFVREMKNYVDFKPVCPEIGIGLGTPRKAIRLVKIGGKKNLYQSSSEKILTKQMNEFAENFVEKNKKIDGFIFKRGSPSCGIDDARIYHKIGTGVGFNKTSGIFSESIMRKFPNLVKEDDRRLNNIHIRENFLTRLFVMARLRKALESRNTDPLNDFYSKNSLLFLCYSKELTTELGLLLKNNKEVDSIESKCKNLVYSILTRIPEKNSILNTFHFIFNLIKSNLSGLERSHFNHLMEEFNQSLIPQSQISTLLYSWALRFDTSHIVEQTFFNPFPKILLSDLIEKKREYSIV